MLNKVPENYCLYLSVGLLIAKNLVHTAKAFRFLCRRHGCICGQQSHDGEMCPKLVVSDDEARFHLSDCLNSQTNKFPLLLREVPLHEIMVGVCYAACATRIPASLLRPQIHANILLVFWRKLLRTANHSVHCLQSVFGDRGIIRGSWSHHSPGMKPCDLTLCMEHVKCVVLIAVLNTKWNKTGYVLQRNNEALSRNHCCSGKAKNITNSERAFVALIIQHALRMRHTVVCGLPDSTILSYIISQTTWFSKKVNIKMCFDILCYFRLNHFPF